MLCSFEAPSLLYYAYGPAFIGSLFFGFFIYLSNRKSPVNKNLFIFVMFFCFWIINGLLGWLIKDVYQNLFFARLSIIEVFSLPFFLFFSYAFTGNDLSLKKKMFYSIPLIVVIPLLLTNYNVYIDDASTCQDQNGVLYWYIYLISIAYIFWSAKILLAHYKNRTGEDSVRKQINIIIRAVVFLVLWFIVFIASRYFFIIRGFDWSDNVALFIPFGMVIFIGMLTYAIAEYKMFNIKLLFAQAIVIGLVFLLGAELLFAESATNQVLILISLLVAVGFGYMLVKSVKLEIKQREEVEKANKLIKKQRDQLKIANDKLKVLDEAKSAFFARASHDLRTPVTVVKGFLSLALEGSYGAIADKVKEALQKSYATTEDMTGLIEDFLVAAQLETGDMKYNFAKARMEDVCQRIIDQLDSKAKMGNIYLKLQKLQDLPELLIDAARVKESITNLVDNAVKYTEKGGVTIALERAESSNHKPIVANDPDEKVTPEIIGPVVRIIVSDTGMGIPKDEVQHLFAKFVRAKSNASKKKSGHGLGLYFCRMMIEDNGGKVWAESEGEGKGSQFIVEFPINPPEAILKKVEEQSQEKPAV